MSGKLAFIAGAGDVAVKIAATVMGAGLVTYGSYMLYDSAYIQNQAFSSAGLLQYKPEVSEDEELSFSALEDSGSSAPGWITVDGTSIDYPVVQGSDDLEYANKDIFGNFSFSGSIYLAAENSGDFSDPYSLIYGHHMDNGSMFGALDGYKDYQFFCGHRDGSLLTRGGAWSLRVFAVMEANAYDEVIYRPHAKQESDIPALLSYIRQHALYFEDPRNVPESRIIGLSTCADNETFGRLVVFAETGAYHGNAGSVIEENETPGGIIPFRKAEARWALINLICMLLTVYMAFPLHRIRQKFRRYRKMKEINSERGEYYEKLKRFRRSCIAGTVIETALALAAAILFVRTEDIRTPMILADRWTPWMLLLLAACWAADVALYRYRGSSGRRSDD